MDGGTGGEWTARTPVAFIFRWVTGTTYLLMAITGLGYLALMWSTVVLLGGFVTVLQKKDFWCLTVISMTQAARIFNDLADQLAPNVVSMLAGNIIVIFGIMRENVRSFARALRQKPAAATTWCMLPLLLLDGIIILPFQGMCYVIACLYGYSGPFVCIALALWRIAQRDYYGGSGDASSSNSGNLLPALDMFYSLVLLQGGLYVLWASWYFDDGAAGTLRAYCRRIGLPDEGWCRNYLARYLSDTHARCWREPASIGGRTLRHFAVDSLDSGSWEDMLSGVRFLDAFVMQGEDIRSQLLPFRPRIQKLIDALGWTKPDGAIEMRVSAARIVAYLARDIHLSQFPGAMECISFLLLHEEATNDQLLKDNQRRRPNQLILQGLAILEGLAFDHHNCQAICSTPGLLCKIMAPLCSAHFINDISNNTYWSFVVNRSLKVLYKLIQAPGKASRRLRREICCSKQSMSNLESILSHGAEAAGLEELQMRAMEILTQLALDVSINLTKETKETLIKKQLQTFLSDGEECVLRPLKEMSGRTMVLLSTKIESNSALIMTVQNDIIGRLTRILDPKNTTTYRTIAAQILENLCTHCDFTDLDKQWVKETLLPKVLGEILSAKRIKPEDRVSPPRNHNITTQQHDIEIQGTSSTEDQNNLSDGGNQEQTTTSKLREAFLTLAVVIRDKLISADDFDDAVQKEGLGPGAFLAKIKAIIEDNCQETAENLRIVKLCCRIVEPMMQRDQYAQHFRNTQFVSSLSNALRIMYNLECEMLFAGTDFGPQKAMRPLLSDILKRALRFLG